MTDRIFAKGRSWEVINDTSSIEFYAFEGGDLHITSDEESGHIQRITFIMTREEATALKEFLIKQGY